MTLKILYAGTPEIAVHPLDALVQSPRVQVVGVLTREDAPVGRKRILTPSPVAQRAEELGLPIGSGCLSLKRTGGCRRPNSR